MEKQAYEEPSVELVEFDSEEIMTTSLKPKTCGMQNATEDTYTCFEWSR